MKCLSRLSLIVVVFVLTCYQSSFAANGLDRLIDKAPFETPVLIAFEGTDNTKESFDKTTLGKIWNSPQVQSFYKTTLDEILRKAKAEEEMTPEDQKIFDKIKENIGLLFSCPAVLGVTPDYDEIAFIIIDVGSKKSQFVELISEFEQFADQTKIKEVTFESREFKSVPEPDGETTF